MPKNVRPSALSLPAVVIIAVALTTAGLPRRVAACPIAPPMPLRQLFIASDLVAVARVADSAVAAQKGRTRLFRVTFETSKLLKGDDEVRRGGFDLYYPVWGADVGESETLAKGETLLLFLTRREEGGGYELTDHRVGMKKLPDEHLKVYVRRVEELAALLKAGKPDHAEIAEWLVRCAEEPATRWEGAFDLAINVEAPAAGKGTGAGENDAKAADATGPAGASVDGGGQGAGASSVSGGEDSGAEKAAEPTDPAGMIVVLPLAARARPDPDFAALLSPAQKERLATALFNAEELGDGGFELLSLVAGWGDARLAPLAIKLLQRMADEPSYEGEMLMTLAADALGDEILIEFAADYRSGAAYDDLGFSEEDEADAAADDEARKEFAEQRAAAAEARAWRSSKVYHFLSLAQQPQKSGPDAARAAGKSGAKFQR